MRWISLIRMCTPLRCSRLLLPRSSLPFSSNRDYAAQVASNHSESRLLGPAVRNLFEQFKITSQDVKGSGPRGFILKGDVLNFIRDQNLKPVILSAGPPKVTKMIDNTPIGKPGPKDSKGRIKYTDIPVSESRRKSASASVEGKKSIPHAYAYVSCNVDQSLKFSENRKGMAKVNLTHFLIRAAMGAVQKVPSAGSETGKPFDVIIERRTDNNQMEFSVLKGANRMGLNEIISGLEKPAMPFADLTDSIFKIVSLTGSRLDQLTANLVHSQVWALSMGDSMTKLESDSKTPSRVVNLALSYDARKMSETEAGHFLELIKSFMERPAMLLIAGSPVKR